MVLSRRIPRLAQPRQRRFGSSQLPGNQTQVPVSVPVLIDNGGSRLVLSNVPVDACWLWSNDSKWVHSTSGQRLKSPADYPGSKIRKVRVMHGDSKGMRPPPGSCHSTGGVYKSQNDGSSEIVLEIEWDDSTETSYFFLNWLMDWIGPRVSTEVTRSSALRRDHTLFQLDYEALQQHGATRLDFYAALFHQGVALVRNCPNGFDSDSESPSAVIGRLLAGSLSHGALYGDIFHVKAIPGAHNLAYTTVRLPPHQDLIYYESPPGLQLLHCLEQRGIIGGVSTLVDGLAAAHALRTLAPDLFEILTTTQATFCKQREGADLVAYCPHIQLSQESHEIIGIHWSPPFEGPIRRVERSQDYYTAYTAFTFMVDKEAESNHNGLSSQLVKTLKEYAIEHTFEKLLGEGDMLVFNNRRMLHGRTSFDMSSEASARHLVGTYTNMDETFNQYRLLMREHGWTNTMLNAGNGSEA